MKILNHKPYLSQTKSICYLFLFSLIFSTPIFSQKIDIDDYYFNTKCIRLPKTELADSIKSYSVVVNDHDNLQKIKKEKSDIITAIDIYGFKKFENGGHFIVEIEINLPDYKNELVDKTTSSKDKDGKIIYQYAYEQTVTVLIPMRYKITNINGEVIEENILSDIKTKQTYTEKYSSKVQEANNNYKFLMRCINSFLTERINTLNNGLNINYGYVPVNVKEKLIIIDSPKHPEHERFTTNTTKTKGLLEGITYEDKPTIELFKESINYFRTLADNNKADDKNQQKIRLAALTNLGQIYYWLELCDDAINIFNEIVKDEFRENDAKEMIVRSNNLKNILLKSRYKTRHFRRDVSNVLNPKVIAEAKELKKMQDVKKSLRETALHVRNMSISLNPKDPENYYEKAKIYEVGAEYNSALVEYNTAIKLNNKNVSYLLARADCYKNLKKIDSTLNDYTRILALDPKNVNVYKLRATVYEEKREYRKRAEDLEQIFSITQAAHDARQAASIYQLSLKDFDKAYQLYRKVIELSPTSFYVYGSLGICANRLKQYKNAVEYFKSYLLSSKELNEYDKEEAYYERGLAYHELGSYEDAINDFKDAIKQRTGSLDRKANKDHIQAAKEKSELALKNK